MKSIDRSLLQDCFYLNKNLVCKDSIPPKTSASYTEDILDISKQYECAIPSTDGRLVCFTYSSHDKKVSAKVMDNCKTLIDVKEENLPRELQDITDPKVLSLFLKNAYAKVSVLSDNQFKIYVNPKLLGGMKNDDDVDELFDDMKARVKNLNKEARGKVVDELKKAQQKFEEAEQKNVSSKEVSKSIGDVLKEALEYVAQTFLAWLFEKAWDAITTRCSIF